MFNFVQMHSVFFLACKCICICVEFSTQFLFFSLTIFPFSRLIQTCWSKKVRSPRISSGWPSAGERTTRL